MAACQASGPLNFVGGSGEEVVSVGMHRPGEAPAMLSVPATIELLAVNDKRQPLAVRQRNVQLALPPGKHRLEVRYFNLWETGFDDHEIVTSKPVILSINVKSGRRYAFEVPPNFTEAGQAEVFVSAFEPKVISLKPAVRVAVPSSASGEQRAAAQLAASKEVVAEPLAPTSKGLDQVKALWSALSDEEKAQFRQWLESVAP